MRTEYEARLMGLLKKAKTEKQRDRARSLLAAFRLKAKDEEFIKDIPVRFTKLHQLAVKRRPLIKASREKPASFEEALRLAKEMLK